MTDDDRSTSGMVPGLVQEFIAQLRATTEKLENLARFGGRLPPTPSALPLPGSLSAAQLRSISASIDAQRHSIEALKSQLSSFDEQLALLEQLLVPITEWSATWAGLEERLLDVWRKPQAGGREGRTSGS